MSVVQGAITSFYKGSPNVWNQWSGIVTDCGCKYRVVVKDCFFRPYEGMKVRVTGHWTERDYKGYPMRELCADSCVRLWHKAEARRELRNAGVVLSGSEFDLFWSIGGEICFQMLHDDPSIFFKNGIPDAQIKVMRDAFGYNDTRDYLKTRMHGLTERQMKGILMCYPTEQQLDEFFLDPYRIRDIASAYGLSGFGFRTLDKYGKMLGISDLDPRRVKAAVLAAATELFFDSGSVCVPVGNRNDSVFFRYVQRHLGQYGNDSIDAIQAALSEGALQEYVFRGQSYYYESRLFERETKLIEMVRRLMQSDACYDGSSKDIYHAIASYETEQKSDVISLDSEQQLSVYGSLQHRLSVLIGGPGCGKTTTAACIVYAWKKRYPERKVYLMAPTGRAARRLELSICKAENSLKQKLHRDPATTVAMALYGKACRNWNYEDSLVLVDESSMLSLADGTALLEKLEGAQVVFCGDEGQLPSISPGNFLRNLCCVPDMMVCRLVTPHRTQKSSLVLPENMKKIWEGVSPYALDWSSNKFVLHGWSDEAGYVPEMVEQYCQYFLKDRKSVALICAKSTGSAGTNCLNQVIQDRVNPVQPLDAVLGMQTKKGVPTPGRYMTGKDSDRRQVQLRVGDYVMCTSNTYGDWGVEAVMNGDCGVITAYQMETQLEAPYIEIMLDNGDDIQVPVEDLEKEPGIFVLAYAITTHKAQGGEYDHVLFSLQHSLRRVKAGFFCRELLYTAVTRAKATVDLYGDPYGFETALQQSCPFRFDLFLERYLDPGEDFRMRASVEVVS